MFFNKKEKQIVNGIIKGHLQEINRLQEELKKEKENSKRWEEAYNRKEYAVAKLSVELCVAEEKLNKLEKNRGNKNE
jgi:hypothetical protein